jgi:hypothetical protein
MWLNDEVFTLVSLFTAASLGVGAVFGYLIGSATN